MLLIEGVGIAALLGLVVVLPALGLRDAISRPDWAWAAAGESKSKWTTVFVCSFVVIIPIVSLAGVAGTAVYWVSRRPKLRAAEAAGQPAEATAAGWYPDPTGGSAMRWWDGRLWTAHTSPPSVSV